MASRSVLTEPQAGMAQPEVGDESTETRAARDFDLLSVLNGYPEVLSVFQGDELVLRVARKPGLALPLPRLVMRALWRIRFAAKLRQRMLNRLALRFAPEGTKPGAHVKAVDVYDRAAGTLICSQKISEPLAIFRQMPASHKDNGANYSCRISLDTTGWPAGVYECVVRDDCGAASQDIYVNIKPPTLENVDLLCILPSFTWQAYNRVGGGSFYSPELGDVRTICTQRPMHHRGDNSIAPALDLLSLFQSRGVRFACIDSWDLHHNRLPIGEAPVTAILVHDEYWSAPMRAQLDRLLDHGTAILVLSGNTCWWHVEVESQNISVRKESGKRALWHLVGAAEEQTLVSSFRFGGYAMERAKQKPRLAGRIAHLSELELRNAGAITVTDLGHPVFAGIMLSDDRLFGREVPVVYRELDGVPLSKDGSPSKAGYKAPNLTPHVIATALALYGKKLRTVGLIVEARVRNGHVLHMGSIGWARGVSQKDAEVTTVVLNAYEHCRAKARDASRKQRDHTGNPV